MNNLRPILFSKFLTDYLSPHLSEKHFFHESAIQLSKRFSDKELAELVAIYRDPIMAKYSLFFSNIATNTPTEEREAQKLYAQAIRKGLFTQDEIRKLTFNYAKRPAMLSYAEQSKALYKQVFLTLLERSKHDLEPAIETYISQHMAEIIDCDLKAGNDI